MLEHQRFARLQHLLDKSNVFCTFLLKRMEEQKLEEMKKLERQSKKEEKEKENESNSVEQKQVRYATSIFSLVALTDKGLCLPNKM